MIRREKMLENIVKAGSKPVYATPKRPMPYSNIGGEETHSAACAPDSIGFYLNCVRKYVLISAKEERELAGKVAKGDGEARRRMIEANLRLAVNMARRYINRGLPIQDLIEEGNIGLIKAVERFNASKGCRFSTYATYWIKQSIERGLANHANTVRLPIHVGADIARVNRVSRELTAQLKREPGTSEISEKTGLSGRYIKKLSLLGKKNCSLDYGPSDDSELPLIDRLPDAAQTAPAELVDQKRTAARVNGWLKRLDRNEQDIIRLRFGLGKGSEKTLEEVGKEFGVTRERIRQIEARALRNLRNIIEQTEFKATDLF